MLLCDKCHDVTAHPAVDFRSLGRCEQCGRLRVCIDCHRQPCTHPEIVALREAQQRRRRVTRRRGEVVP